MIADRKQEHFDLGTTFEFPSAAPINKTLTVRISAEGLDEQKEEIETAYAEFVKQLQVIMNYQGE